MNIFWHFRFIQFVKANIIQLAQVVAKTKRNRNERFDSDAFVLVQREKFPSFSISILSTRRWGYYWGTLVYIEIFLLSLNKTIFKRGSHTWNSLTMDWGLFTNWLSIELSWLNFQTNRPVFMLVYLLYLFQIIFGSINRKKCSMIVMLSSIHIIIVNRCT